MSSVGTLCSVLTKSNQQPAAYVVEKLAVRRSGHQSRDPSGQLLKTSFRGQCYTQGKLKDYNRLSDGAEPVRTTVLPSPLCPTRVARGHDVLQGVREGVLDERKPGVEGLWTQTCLARDVLDGWSCLRPFVDDVPARSDDPVTVPRPLVRTSRT